MALSNWDTLAFDDEGKPIRGVLLSQDEKSYVEAYKNWLHYARKDGDFGATINHGDVRIGSFEIEAIRGPQASVIAVVQTYFEIDKRFSKKRMFVISGSGYSDPAEAIAKAAGVDLSEWEDYSTGTRFGGGESEKVLLWCYKKVAGVIISKDFELDPRPEFEAEWIGITQETLAFGLNWLKENFTDPEHKEWIAKIEQSTPLRYNQGDAFFADALQKEIPATQIGQASPTIMQQMLEKKE